MPRENIYTSFRDTTWVFYNYRFGAKPIYSKSIKREPPRHESYPVENWIYQTFRGTNRYFIDCEKQFAFNWYHSGELKLVITKCATKMYFFFATNEKLKLNIFPFIWVQILLYLRLSTGIFYLVPIKQILTLRIALSPHSDVTKTALQQNIQPFTKF